VAWLRGLPLAALAALLVAVAGFELVPSFETRTARTSSHGFANAGLLRLPLAAQGPVSQALGGSDPRYRVRASHTGLVAVNPSGHMLSSFSRDGVSVAADGARVGLRLLGIGMGSGTTAFGKVAPVARGGLVSYAHGEVSEWYVNGPLGLEQGFTIHHRPAGSVAGALALSVGISGDTRTALAPGGKSVSFSLGARRVLRYGGLAVSDARGRVLPAWLSLSPEGIVLHVDARDASYPVVVDPFVQQGEKLAGESGSSFGVSVALSADGNTAVVGGDGANKNVGAAWVFVRSGGKWTQQGEKLTGAGETGEGSFGSSVALSSDGNTALIGGEQDNGGKGAAWVFTRAEGKWTQQGEKLTGGGESENAWFGQAVALSSDGNTALVGGPRDNEFIRGGAAWVFTRSEGKWTQQGEKLTGKEAAGLTFFGSSVALSSDGNTAVVSGPEGHESSGAVWVFTRAEGKWTQQGEELTGAEEVGHGAFGTKVAVSSDGNTALIGGYEDNKTQGAAWVFTRSEGKWAQQGGKLTGTGESGNGGFGSSVALSSDGNIALIGGYEDHFAQGAAWVFTRSGEKWSQQGEKLKGGGEVGAGFFGISVALSGDGVTALVGGYGDESSRGAAWVFLGPRPPVAVSQPASEVADHSAVLHGEVTPEGAATTCEFELGTTVAYGIKGPCSPIPGSETDPVSVSSSPSGLTPNTVYHYRLRAENSQGVTFGSDETFTTLQSSASAETKEAGKPAKATDKGLSVEGSGGTGKVTIGPYGSHIGGPPLADSHGSYLQVYHSEGASFTKIEYKDCELGGAKAIWWENPATGWEPIQPPVAVYSEETKCITVTATDTTAPSIAQLNDPRHVGGPAASEQIGKCEPAKHGHFSDAFCKEEAKSTEKGGVVSYKGKYEWLAAPVGCFGLKHGHYGEACGKEEFSENKKHEKKYKGKFEKGENAFTVTGTSFVIKPQGQASVECLFGVGSAGLMRTPNLASVSLTLTKCEREKIACSNTSEAGNIVSAPLESYGYEESGEYFTTLAAQTMMSFTCGARQFRLSGTAAGQLKVTPGTVIASSEASFSEAVGAQELELEEVGMQTSHPASLTTTTITATEQPIEIRFKT
jgi:hypothetical protein